MQQSDDLELIACALRDLVAAQHAQHADYAAQQEQAQRHQQLGSGWASSSSDTAHSAAAAAAAPHVPPPPIITRSYFRRYMRARLCPSVRLSRSQLDYLFEQFDKDKVW